MTHSDRLILFARALRDKFNSVTPRLLPAAGNTGQVLAKTATTDYATGWVDPGYPQQITRTAVAQASSSVAVENITGLTAALAAGGVYRVTGRVVFQTAGLAVGATVGFNGPAGSVGQMVVAVPTTALVSTNTATTRSNASFGSASTTSVAAVATNMVATVDGIITVGSTAGALTLQIGSSSVLGTVTVQPGSMLLVERLS